MTYKRAIKWEKWQDPFRAVVNQYREEHDDDDDEDGEAWKRRGRAQPFHGPVLSGPMGHIPLTETNMPSNRFNLWVGHANFNLGPAAHARIQAVPGVEIFQVWSRYRFWIGIGRAFNEREVKTAVEKAVCQNPPLHPALEKLRDDLKGKFRAWAIVVHPGGNATSLGTNNADGEVTLRQKVKEWPDATQVITSWEQVES